MFFVLHKTFCFWFINLIFIQAHDVVKFCYLCNRNEHGRGKNHSSG